MSKLNRFNSPVFLLSFLALMGCGHTYQDLVREEVESGARHDSIFFEIGFGDTPRDFFDKCWKKNKEAILFHGPKNMNVQYTIPAPSEEVSNIMMLFYPDFNYSKEIRKMDVEFGFTGWAPWNKHLHSDPLIGHVKDIVLEWYPGNGFVVLTDERLNTIHAKIDGNREIKMWTLNNHYVKMSIVDKSHKKQ